MKSYYLSNRLLSVIAYFIVAYVFQARIFRSADFDRPISRLFMATDQSIRHFIYSIIGAPRKAHE